MLTGRYVRGLKSHFVVVSINICVLCVFVDRSIGKYVLMSAILLICTSIHIVRPLINRCIGIPSVNFCPLIGVFESPLIDRFGRCVLLSFFPADVTLCPFSLSVDKLIN